MTQKQPTVSVHAHPSSYLCLFSRSAPSTILSNLIFRQSIVHVVCSYYYIKVILRFVHILLMNFWDIASNCLHPFFIPFLFSTPIFNKPGRLEQKIGFQKENCFSSFEKISPQVDGKATFNKLWTKPVFLFGFVFAFLKSKRKPHRQSVHHWLSSTVSSTK